MAQPLPNILVVEDDRETRTLIAKYLRANACHVTTAGDGREMTRVMTDRRVDLLILARAIQGAANAIGPGKRPLSSMAPTIVVHEGKTVLVLGSPGSSKIITTVANVLMGVIDYGMNIQESVNAPRFHNQWLPDLVNVERSFSFDTVNALQKMGYTVQVGLHDDGDVSPYWSDAECIARGAKTAERLGASDYRNNGKAVGY